MVYHSYPGEGYETGSARIGLAYTEDETLHQWTRLAGPVLSWEDGAEWKRGGLYKGCLVEYGRLYYLFYNAKNSENWIWKEQIGVAVSENLLHWVKYPAPILLHGGKGEVDELHAHKPGVITKDGCLYHFYCAVRPGREGDRAYNMDPTGAAQKEYRCISVAFNRENDPMGQV